MEWINIANRRGIFLSLILLFCISCQQHKTHNAYALYYVDEQSKVMDSRMLLDRVSLEYFKDSILIQKIFPGSDSSYFEVHLIRQGDNFYERRSRGNDFGELFGTDYILTLSLKDATFIYKSARESPLSASDFSYADCKYKIRRDGDGYISIKQSIVDTTFTEQFYYDEQFRINKYIVTFQDNKLVYEIASK